jgi:L-idonate 5-dehydrogenase
VKSLQIRGKLEAKIVDVEIPEPSENQVRIKVAYVGICGSDLHYYFEGANGAFVVREPLVPGHELSAILDFDPRDEISVGTPLTVHPATFGKSEPAIADRPHLWPQGSYLGSASTWPHTQGAASEYLIVERSMVRILPAGVSLRIASLAEPLAVSFHAINIAGGVSGKKVLVSGSGPIGLLTAAAAIISGASQVTASDLSTSALDRASSLGVQNILLVGVDEIPENTYDVVFECAGVAPSLSSALVAVVRGGIVVQVGMLSAGKQEIVIAPLVSKEVQLRGAFRFNTEIKEALTALEINPWVEQVITHEFALNEFEAAFNTAKDSQSSGKVLLKVGNFL